MTPSYAETRSALEIVNNSYTYDPPEQWIASYELLAGVRAQLVQARKAFAWIALIGVAGFIGTAFYSLLFAARTPDPYSFRWIFFGIGVQGLSVALGDFLARRREPLLKLQDAINTACRKFEEAGRAPQRRATNGAA